MEPRTDIPDELAVIAGKGAYPLLLAESARAQGVKRVVVIAFTKETDAAIEKLADEVKWFRPGQFGRAFDAIEESSIKQAVMAGQITPAHLFHTRLDSFTIDLLKRLKSRNARTIFGAIAGKLEGIGVALLPAHLFMESNMPGPGVLSAKVPDDKLAADIGLGFIIATTTSDLSIGQTVVVKDGTVLAVEAFEGTNETIKRAGRLGGPGATVVKVAGPGHDMRFDIPVIGTETMVLLKKIRASALALEAHRSIILEKDKVTAMADDMGLCLVAADRPEPE